MLRKLVLKRVAWQASDIKAVAQAKTSTGGAPVPSNYVTVEQFKTVLDKTFANKGLRRLEGLVNAAKVTIPESYPQKPNSYNEIRCRISCTAYPEDSCGPGYSCNMRMTGATSNWR